MNQFFLGLGILILFVCFGVFILYRAHLALKEQLNGRLTELLVVTKALAKANGIAEGIVQGREEYIKEHTYDPEKHNGDT